MTNIFITEPDLYEQYTNSNPGKFKFFYTKCPDWWNEKRKIDALAVGLKYIIDDRFLSNLGLDNIDYIITCTTGIDHIQISNKNIKIINLDPKEIADISSTAEFTIGMMISLVRGIHSFNSMIYDPRQYTYDIRKVSRSIQFKNKTIGIFGIGRIGSQVKTICEALGMNCLLYDKHNSKDYKTDILKRSDIITIHLPLNEETTGFIDGDDFRAMVIKKPYIINTARPQIIGLDNLIRALKNNYISGFAMDFMNYDYSDRFQPELLEFGDRVMLTPHIAGNTFESIDYASNVVMTNFERLMKK